MDFSTFVFFLLAGLLVLSSLLVVFLRNVVHCALALVSALLMIAVLFVTLHAPMLGVLQVMVYAGAIMVLFLVRHHVSQSRRSGAGRHTLVEHGNGAGCAARRFVGAVIF